MTVETVVAICAIVVAGVLSAVAALVLGPRKISDDVMQQIVGDAPHMDER